MNVNSERYSRQVLLSEIGVEGQQKLFEAKVLVVGAGGLGCPVLQYIAAAGVGTLGIIDDDVINESNLHRQILYGVDDIGKSKAETAAQKIIQQNPGVEVQVLNTRLIPSNTISIINDYDIVVDGSDNFSTRYMVNDACVLLQKPLVYGSIFRFEGQVSVFNHNSGLNYRDVYPVQPGAGEVPGCAEAGVMGVVTGIIGSLMANEVIKIITGAGRVLSGSLLTYNALQNHFYEIDLQPAGDVSAMPKNRKEFESHNYGEVCTTTGLIEEVDAITFGQLLHDGNALVIDVREPGELPQVNEFDHQQLPISGFGSNGPVIDHETIVLFCQSGVRSRNAANIIGNNNPGCKKIYTLKGGILQWKQQQTTRVR